MAADINVLLEEAVRRSTELTARAKAAETETGEILRGAAALHSFSMDESETLHRAMTDALGAVHEARDRVADEGRRIGALLDGLPARADTTETAVAGLLATVREDAAQLLELRRRLVERADESTRQADADLQELARSASDLAVRLDSGLVEASGQVDRLREAVASGRRSLEEEHARMTGQIQSLAVLAGDEAGAFAATLHAVMLTLGRRLVELCNVAVYGHNAAMLELRGGLTDDSPNGALETWVFRALQPVRAAVQDLVDLQSPADETLGGAVESILQKAEHTLATLESIGDALEQAAPRYGPGLADGGGRP
ncbi:MAG: hypothetical protein ABW221_23525 [Vicinamibacteria bacterium]